jgi:Ca-activated chloride channel family protein
MPVELTNLEYFHFLRPAWALLLLPWIILFAVRNRRENRPDMFGGIIAPHLLEHLRVSRFRSRWLNPRSFTTALLLLLMILLMGPSWRQQPSPLSQDDAALVILLDVSNSMQARDVQPSRLQRAKQKIHDLLALRPDKKAALVVYAGSAHTVLTLTADQEIIDQYLAAIATEIMPREGKFPEYGLPLVDEILRESTAPSTVLLLADGVGADSQRLFADYFDSRPHQLLVTGIGTDGGASAGEMAPLERAALERLADTAGGRYVALTVDDSDVRALNRRIDSYYVVLEDSALPWLDSGYWLVFPAMALFLMWFRKGWTLTWSVLLVPALLAGSPTPARAVEPDTDPRTASHWFANIWLTHDQQGRLLMQLGRYPEAARRFDNPLWKAMAYYYNEDFMLAAEYFSRSDSDDALFDEANARAHARDYVRAVKRYDRLLARTPDYPGAAENRAAVQALIDEINRLSESQQEEEGVGGDKELGPDDPRPADGADTIEWQQAELRQFTAEEILQDPATSEMWLKGVQQDPSEFLAIKFNMQLQARTDSGEKGGQ